MSFITAKLEEVKNNPFRTDEAYVYDQHKIDSLKESIETTSFWENLLARKTKAGVIQLAYGHHRLEALRQMVDSGIEKYKEIKINVRPDNQLTDEMMLKILVQENKDDWRDIPQNLCMSLLQVKAHIMNILNSCTDVAEFFKRMGTSAPAMKMDARSFARFKNEGIGASTIAQFLGETWSRQTIQDALKLIEAGEQSDTLRKLAETLPNVTLAHRFSKLMTKSVDGKGAEKTIETFDDETQTKAAKKILSNDLSRADVEAAINIVATQAPDAKDPVAALDAIVAKKKEALKAAKEAEKSAAPAKRTPLERVQVAFDVVRELMEKYTFELSKGDLKVIASHIDATQTLLVQVAEAQVQRAEQEAAAKEAVANATAKEAAKAAAANPDGSVNTAVSGKIAKGKK